MFLSSGQEIADVATGGHLFDLVLREDNEYILKSGDSEATLPSQWLLRDVVPAVEPYLLGETWWEEYLLVCIRSSTHHPCVVDTLRKCSITTVRSVLIIFIFTLMHDPHLDERKRKEFELLAQYSDGLLFNCKCPTGKLCSPMSIALECGTSFLNFRELLRLLDWDIRELIQTSVDAEEWMDKGYTHDPV